MQVINHVGQLHASQSQHCSYSTRDCVMCPGDLVSGTELLCLDLLPRPQAHFHAKLRNASQLYGRICCNNFGFKTENSYHIKFNGKIMCKCAQPMAKTQTSSWHRICSKRRRGFPSPTPILPDSGIAMGGWHQFHSHRTAQGSEAAERFFRMGRFLWGWLIRPA